MVENHYDFVNIYDYKSSKELELVLKELGADSLDLLEMIMNLEDEYGVKFDTNRLEELKNVGEVIDYLKELGIEA